MDGARASLAEGKRGMVALTERVQSLQTELTQSELRRGELEAELAHTQEVCERDFYSYIIITSTLTLCTHTEG